MAGGWARDGAVQDQIDASVEDAVERARSRLPRGKSLLQCEDCGAEIPQGRRERCAAYACASSVRASATGTTRRTLGTTVGAARTTS